LLFLFPLLSFFSAVSTCLAFWQALHLSFWFLFVVPPPLDFVPSLFEPRACFGFYDRVENVPPRLWVISWGGGLFFFGQNLHLSFFLFFFGFSYRGLFPQIALPSLFLGFLLFGVLWGSSGCFFVVLFCVPGFLATHDYPTSFSFFSLTLSGFFFSLSIVFLQFCFQPLFGTSITNPLLFPPFFSRSVSRGKAPVFFFFFCFLCAGKPFWFFFFSGLAPIFGL